MFKLHLKFPVTAEKQSQRQRPAMAKALRTLLWGRRLSTTYRSATFKWGRHSCQEYIFQPLGCFQHLVCIFNSTHEQNLQNLIYKQEQQPTEAEPPSRLRQITDPSRRGQTKSLSPEATSTIRLSSSEPSRATQLSATGMCATPSNGGYKSHRGSRGQSSRHAYSSHRQLSDRAWNIWSKHG